MIHLLDKPIFSIIKKEGDKFNEVWVDVWGLIMVMWYFIETLRSEICHLQ